MSSAFTVCVTNFKRADKLRRVLESVRGAQVVVATYGSTPENVQIVKAVSPHIPHFYTPEDHGCNRLWIQAAEMARTRWISFLPDDDLRPPGFVEAAESFCGLLERNNAGFGAWNGQAFFWNSGKLGHAMNTCFEEEGVYASGPLVEKVLRPGTYPFSQVAFLYDRETTLDVLQWCEANLKDCCTRPEMMIGNDIALTLGHAQRFSRVGQCAKRLTWYGHWDGSETLQAGNTNLMRAYDLARLKLAGVVFPVRKPL